jgi:predicted nuclease of predicted toxin-antitoxin system
VGETLRLYLDQMISSEVARELADQGYDTLRASETGQNRADDQQILQKAISENRILITLDEHFGDWVILPLSQHPGVIRVRVHPTTSQRVLNLLLPFLRAHTQEQFKGHLVILSEKRAKWMLTAQSAQ